MAASLLALVLSRGVHWRGSHVLRGRLRIQLQYRPDGAVLGQQAPLAALLHQLLGFLSGPAGL